MSSNLDIIFLGGLFPKEIEATISENSKGNVQNAANNLQWEIVLGIDSNINNKLKIINSLYIGSYPKRYKKILIPTTRFAHSRDQNDAQDINVGFINLTGFKNYHRYHTLKPFVKEWAETNSRKKKVVIAYAMTLTFTRLLRYAKKLDPNIVTCLIVPDLPQYMNLSDNKNHLYNVIKNIEIKAINSDKKYIDSYVLLTEQMKEILNISAPFTVIEGISTNSFDDIEEFRKVREVKTILYTGSLSIKYGIVDLIEAFKEIKDENLELVICGEGEAKDYILEQSIIDSRIIYKGLLERRDILTLQKSSTVLVNPRTNNESYTKYSFPSKILEYMSSGTPVIAYKLDGMPDEYSEYFYEVDDSYRDGLKMKIEEVLNKPKEELSDRGKKAKDFVLKNKNKTVQTKKILEMIYNL